MKNTFVDKRLFGLPDRIKQLREQRGLTQSGLANILHLSRASVSSWEMGLSLPSLQSLAELSRLFEVSTDFLLCMDHDSVISVDGLNERQIKAVVEIINCFKAG